MQQDHTLNPKTLGQLIRERRGARTREELADLLEIDGKTLQKWEQGLVIRIHLKHRQRLHEVLDIPSQLLNIPDHLTLQGARKLQEQVPSFLEQGAYVNAEQISSLLIRGCTMSGNHYQEAMRPILARACYTKGLATATLMDKPSQALLLFKDMEHVANELEDGNGLAIALTYQSEMYRRMGELYRQQSRAPAYKGHLTLCGLCAGEQPAIACARLSGKREERKSIRDPETGRASGDRCSLPEERGLVCALLPVQRQSGAGQKPDAGGTLP
jgi:transcriptional regulator with XRE-family HTH domain